jgi:hypothetical protein
MKNVKNISIQIVKINRLIRYYLNTTNELIYQNKFNTEAIGDLNLNELLEEIINIENAKKDFIVNNENNYFINSIFDRYQDTVLRTFSNLIILNKENKGELLSPENLEYIIDYCRDFIKNNHNEGKSYFAKRVLINYYTSPGFYYSDYVVEINQKDNFADFAEKGRDNV